ncbi:MAG TPA: hypothetical protein VNK82_06755 [Terriglobales bacterium]|nr:hypothetical protein [Terriglobales bacterium]
MPCEELGRLRQQIAELQSQLKEKQRLARQWAEHNVAASGSRRDWEEFLSRKIAHTAARIEQHLREHGCQE